jgi:hypothetical protein
MAEVFLLEERMISAVKPSPCMTFIGSLKNILLMIAEVNAFNIGI